MVATASTEHSYWLALAFVALNFHATNASASQYECSVEAVATQALAFLAVFVYATHATQAIAFEWKPGFTLLRTSLSYRLVEF